MSDPLNPSRDRRWFWACLAVGIFVGVTLADYWTGFELSFTVFYLSAVLIATWHYGWAFGLVLSIVSVVFSLIGDLASGARYSSALVPWWNMGIFLSFYLCTMVVVMKLRSIQQKLEVRVRERTADLQEEIETRKVLEQSLLEVSEREQQRIGHELHDSLCQHLTGTAFAAQVLSGSLSGQGNGLAKDADHLVAMIGDGIDLSRKLARGLAPVELDGDGLMTGLRELVRQTEERGVMCALETPVQLPGLEPAVTTQLFRICQEAVRNAVSHGDGVEISVRLEKTDGGGVGMEIRNECGKPDGKARPATDAGGGIGLHIMRYRASMIGAELEAGEKGGVYRVMVMVPPKAEIS
ncbi:histidine kinase [Luteolibacter flavescens]|uniref:histidine kinase n=1 Tax=Luteolibacter flavescens TaxID=1859460 RepID=A0ABT3FIS8_9BACT|nr:histidine kinase [Luteolibacter flavescens]MCW1883468.1 histidine kinase [Luteolibacter flavescens]